MSWHNGGHKNSEWISRQIASLGRYAEKRPSGLHVDARGTLHLKNLMQAWGELQGLTEKEVIDAVWAHRSYEEGGDQRFTIDKVAGGDYSICVHKRNRRGNWQQKQQQPQGAGSSGSHWQQSRWSGSSGAPSERTQSWEAAARTAEPTHAARGTRDQRQEWAADGADDETSRPVATPTRKAFNIWSASAATEDTARGASGVQRESDDSQKDNKRWNRDSDDSKKDNKRWKQAGADDKESRSNGEQVQRWLGWILKSGHHDAGIHLKDGEWASLEDLAEVLGRSKANLRVSSAQELREVLEATDQAGRFEISSQGHVRKVQRDSRTARATSGDCGKKTWGSVTHSSPKAKSPHGDAAVSERESGSPQKRRVTLNGHERARVASPEEEVMSPEESPARDNEETSMLDDFLDAPAPPRGAPGKPPGPDWKKYVDGETHWWYYEGPLGKWWVQEDGAEPEPYPDDQLDEEE